MTLVEAFVGEMAAQFPQMSSLYPSIVDTLTKSPRLGDLLGKDMFSTDSFGGSMKPAPLRVLFALHFDKW